MGRRPQGAGGPALPETPSRVTGERVMTRAGGFNPTWQRHVAAYALCERHLPEGRLLDLGCGVGHSYELLAPRETVGVDNEPSVLSGQARETHVADMRELPFADESFDAVLSVHSVEHVPDPERVVAEAARVLGPAGAAAFVTPNRLTFGRPDEIIDPYHRVELGPGELRDLCAREFGAVRILGLFGSGRYMRIFDRERRALARLLRADPLRLRRAVPRRARQVLYDELLRRRRAEPDPGAAAIGIGDFELRESGLGDALDLIAVCAEPRRARPCPWCGAAGARSRPLPGRRRCLACGAASADPWPSERELDAAYGDWYRPASGRRFGFPGDALLRRTRGALARHINAIAPAGPILDVGAGDGALLSALADRGRTATGLERDAGPGFRSEPIEELEGEGDWAAVVFWHALEHLPRPGAAIDAAARLLRPGGIVVIAVPDSDSLQARAFGDRWLHLDPPRHLVHLSTASLKRGLRARGFTVRRTSHVRGGQIVIGWLAGLVGSLPGRLDLYGSLRHEGARPAAIPAGKRVAAIGAGVALLPPALALAVVEIALRRSGTVYVEARRG